MQTREVFIATTMCVMFPSAVPLEEQHIEANNHNKILNKFFGIVVRGCIDRECKTSNYKDALSIGKYSMNANTVVLIKYIYNAHQFHIKIQNLPTL